jgi:hypothetical protein
MKFNPDFFSLKTSLRLKAEDSESFYKNLPSEGMIVAGQCYRLPKSERRTKGNDGFCWPTPSASNTNEGEDHASWEARRQRLKLTGKNGNGAGTPLAQMVYKKHPELNRCRINPVWLEWLMGFPAMWTMAYPVILEATTGSKNPKTRQKIHRTKSSETTGSDGLETP